MAKIKTAKDWLSALLTDIERLNKRADKLAASGFVAKSQTTIKRSKMRYEYSGSAQSLTELVNSAPTDLSSQAKQALQEAINGVDEAIDSTRHAFGPADIKEHLKAALDNLGLAADAVAQEISQ